jgi:ParB family chromosome partitioning protein
MTIETIEIETIDASGRLRPVNQAWVDTMAEEVAAGATLPAIEVVETAPGAYRLITGAHRLAVAGQLGFATIEAIVWPASAFADESKIRLKEIQENMLRYEQTELDRAVAIAEWKRIFEAANPTPKRGRKAAGEMIPESGNIFVERFSEAAARALGISESSVYVAVEIAKGLDQEVRLAIAAHPIADHQSELLALARQPAERQQAIVALLLDPDQGIGSVATAIAALDKTPAPARAPAWEKLSGRFSKLKESQQHAFFEAHFDAISLWLAKRPIKR